MEMVQELIRKIKELENELIQEFQKKEEEFFYRVRRKKILFKDSVKANRTHITYPGRLWENTGK